MRRRLLVTLVMLAAAGVIAVAALVDHRDKQARINRAELAEWYCAHLGTRCGGASSARIEAHWNQRQTAYEIVVGGFAAAALVLAGPAAIAAARRASAPGA